MVDKEEVEEAEENTIEELRKLFSKYSVYCICDKHSLSMAKFLLNTHHTTRNIINLFLLKYQYDVKKAKV